MTDEASPLDLGQHLEAMARNMAGPIPIFLGNLDQTLTLLVGNLHHPRHLSSARMFLLGFGSLRAAVALTLAGSASQVPALVRHAVECGLYGFLFQRDTAFAEHWAQRETDKKAKTKFRKEGLQRAKELLKQYDAHFAETVKEQLDYLVSFGAHPNVLQLVGITKTVFDEKTKRGHESVGILAGQEERSDAYLQLSVGYTTTILLYEAIWPEKFNLLCGGPRIAEAVRQFREFRETDERTA